jgi:hypothetical protein
MWSFHLIPAPLLSLLTTILLTPTLTLARPPLENGIPWEQLFERQACAGQVCGWNGQLCCPAGACYTNAANQAQCSSTVAGVVVATTQAVAGGYWQYYTTTYVETDLETITATMSTYLGGAVATPAAATPAPISCNYALNESPCGSICCASGQYCYELGQCKAAANGGSSGYYSSYYSTMYASTNAAGVPLRPTSSTLVIVTETNSPTTTVPFETPIATGANMTITTAEASNGGGLSGGAIAGIVIGVLLGLALLALLIFCCCVRGIWAALFGGKKKKRVTEVDTYERYSHHGSGGGAAAGRTWYGAARPARVERRDSHKGRDALGIAAGLGALWAVLGLKRRNSRKHEEKVSEYSYSSDYYTSESEYSPGIPPKSIPC